MKLIKKTEDKVMNKDIYELEVEHIKQKTPDRKTIIEMANKDLRIDKNLMVIKSIKNIFGKNISKAVIHAYKTRQDLEKSEPKHLIKRVTFKEESKEEVKE